MTLTLMKNYSDYKTLDKNVGVLSQIECTVYNECSILNPVMLLKYNEYLVNCNYAYVSDFNRYYYTGSPILLPGNRCILQLYVDVFMSHKEQIKQIYCTISRYEQTGITMLPDANITTAGNSINIYNFPEAFQENGVYSYVLSVLGGV